MESKTKWVTRAVAPLAMATVLSSVIGCGGAKGGGGGAAAPAGTKSCGPDGVIDDNEDNNNQTNPAAGRGGYWYTFVDKLGTTVTPTAGEQGGGAFTMSQGGAGGSKYAAHMNGKIGKVDRPPDYLFAGMGLNFLDPKGPYDASKYKGLTFWAKKGPGSTGKVRLKVPDADTDPEGKVCKECFNDYGENLSLTEEWKQYTFAFSDLAQLPGWGDHPAAIAPAKLYGLQFQVNQPGANFDVWVDNLEFICP